MPIPQQRSTGTIGAIPVPFIQQVNPDLIVGYDAFIQSFMVSAFVNQYIWFRAPIDGSSAMQMRQDDIFWIDQDLNVFIRQDLVTELGSGGQLHSFSLSELNTLAVKLLGPSV